MLREFLVLRDAWCRPLVRWRAASYRGSLAGASCTAHCGLRAEVCSGAVRPCSLGAPAGRVRSPRLALLARPCAGAPPTLFLREGRHQPSARAGERVGVNMVRERVALFRKQRQHFVLSFAGSAAAGAPRAASRSPWFARGRRGKLALMARHEVLLHQPPNCFIERTANGGAHWRAPSTSVAPSAAAHVQR